MMLSLDLIFDNTIFISFKTRFIQRTRASISGMIHKHGNKSKKYYRIHNISLWKLHNILKDEIKKKYTPV